MKKNTSVSGALLFRSISAVIIFFTCFTVFLIYTDDVSKKIDLLAREKVIKEINVALSMRLFQAAIEGSLYSLSEVDKQNPFTVLHSNDYSVPKEYRGVLGAEDLPVDPGWYYNRAEGFIFYWDGESDSFKAQLQFIYRDTNNSGRFDANKDVIEKLEMVRQ